LEAAEAWGTPPWEIFGGDRLTWYLRFVVRRGIKIEQVNKTIEEQQSK
jgi:hypothetical protein